MKKPRSIFLLALCTALGAALLPAVPSRAADYAIKLIDVAARAGITLRNVCGDVSKDYIVDANGSGAAWIDYDNDGNLDLLIVNGSTRDHMKQGGDPMVALYRNDGKGHFEDVTARSGLTRRGWGSGVCVADYDNDGYSDVYISGIGGGALFHNNGNGTFADVTRRARVGNDGRWGSACAFGDYNRDGFVDLYVSNYVKFNEQKIPRRGETAGCRFLVIDVYCGPKSLEGEPDVLYKNNGDGTFSDVTASAQIKDPGYPGFGVLFSDLDNDGWPDIYVANDSTPHLLFHNNGNGTFTEKALMAGVAVSGDGREQAGMGVDAGDYNGDGLLDLVVTNFSHDYNTLYENHAGGFFTDVSYRTGIAAGSGPYMGWGVGFVDVDNDGLLDLFIANGHVYPQVDEHGIGTKYAQRKQLFKNVDGHRFRNVTDEVGEGLLLERSSRGAAFGDYDNDGRVDVIVINMNDVPTLLHNESAGGHWATFRLVGTKSNRDGVGAKVVVTANGRRQLVEVRSGGSYASHNDLRAHVGLGAATRIDRVEIRWPSGLVETSGALTADRFYVAR
ncbi:MAG TPA: CRTAC1 family protein, partial [Vicinamibacterales bacterium]|nr:CRTAC1 family protein [Vicinamibacterales bacterium]